MQPGTSEEQLPLTGTDKDIPYTDVMGGSGIVSLTIKYFKVPVTIGVFPEGGFIIVATFDIESLSTKYSSLFEESWNPKTREAGESIFEPFKQEFWRKSDRFKSGTGQMNDSKRATVVKDKNWSFDNVNENESILSQVIFNLTPFQQSVYDSIDSNTSFDEIKRSLIRYKSKNFENKIQRNIDELIELNLIERIGENSYSKTNS